MKKRGPAFASILRLATEDRQKLRLGKWKEKEDGAFTPSSIFKS
jgi:hypothetical protein